MVMFRWSFLIKSMVFFSNVSSKIRMQIVLYYSVIAPLLLLLLSLYLLLLNWFATIFIRVLKHNFWLWLTWSSCCICSVLLLSCTGLVKLRIANWQIPFLVHTNLYRVLGLGKRRQLLLGWMLLKMLRFVSF